MNNIHDLSRLQDEHLDLMLKLTFALEEDETISRLLDNPDPTLTPEEEKQADAILARAYARIDAQKKQSRQQDAQGHTGQPDLGSDPADDHLPDPFQRFQNRT